MLAPWVRRSVLAVALAAVVPCTSKRAEAHGEEILGALAVAAVAPSEAGTSVTPNAPSPVEGLLGWSWQIPLGHEPFRAGDVQRVVVGADLLFGAQPSSWRGRVGYRLAWRNLLVGVGPEVTAHQLSLSPELGFKLAHSEEAGHRDEVDPSLHVLARAAVGADGFRGATLLVGWSFL
jgi:hypothetical protein